MIQLLLRQMDNFRLVITSKKAARDLFHDIGVKIKFPIEVESNIILFEVLGLVKDCNGVNIIQAPNYIEMSSKSYIDRLLKSHGLDALSPKPLPTKSIALPKNVIPIDPTPTTATAASIHKFQMKKEDGLPIQPVSDDSNDEKSS